MLSNFVNLFSAITFVIASFNHNESKTYFMFAAIYLVLAAIYYEVAKFHEYMRSK
jgi:hypothetical protein